MHLVWGAVEIEGHVACRVFVLAVGRVQGAAFDDTCHFGCSLRNYFSVEPSVFRVYPKDLYIRDILVLLVADICFKFEGLGLV